MLNTDHSYVKSFIILFFTCSICHLTASLYGVYTSTQILPTDALPHIPLEKYISSDTQGEVAAESNPLSSLHIAPKIPLLKKETASDEILRKKPLRPKKQKKPKKPPVKPSKKKPVKISLQRKRHVVKDWTVIIYVAADNDLNFFAWKNIKQMEQIGSNEHLNIVIQLSERGKHKPTQRYAVEKNHLLKCKLDNKKLNSGSPNTLINFCSWAIQSYPAKNYALILWNHGTGANEPTLIKNVNSSDLFIFNPSNNLLELDRSIGFFDFIDLTNKENQEYRGICFDETHRSYISNQQLDSALNTICSTYLQGKFGIIGFDACLMSMIEVAHIVKKYAHIMVGSQEVELGAGWNYSDVLKLFNNHSPSLLELAQHTVRSYQQIYGQLTNDYTQSAIRLDMVQQLEDSVQTIACLLIECLDIQKDSSIKNVIKMCRSRKLCTSFDEPTYIDLHNFYSNLLKNISYLQFTDHTKGEFLKEQLQQKLSEGIQILDSLVIANCVGKNLSNAKGISIYLPEHKIHPSYLSTPFAQKNHWGLFLQRFIATN